MCTITHYYSTTADITEPKIFAQPLMILFDLAWEAYINAHLYTLTNNNNYEFRNPGTHILPIPRQHNSTKR